MNISPSFSPSIKILKPYFLLSLIFYLLSFITLLFVDINSNIDDMLVVGWVHTYIIGFVLIAIMASMAQLGPVINETKHFKVEIFKYLWIVLLIGLILLLYGFYINIIYITFGGILLFGAFSIYVFELLITLSHSNRNTTISNTMFTSHLFLIFGLFIGIAMSLGFNGIFVFDINSFLKVHSIILIVGFVLFLVMAISLVLIPMFGSSKRINENDFKWSFYSLSLSVLLMILYLFTNEVIIENISYTLAISSVLFYLYQIFSIIKTRKNIEYDIWTKYMFVGFLSFLISFILICIYLFILNDLILKIGMWLMLIGFFGSFIIGNFYKIIPFLVWFHIYSPLVETQSVPMLHELIPKKSSNIQLLMNSLGLILTSTALVIGSNILFICGVIIFIISSIFLLQITYNLLQVK